MIGSMDENEARRRLTALKFRLEKLVEHDAEQEVQGMAIPVLDAIINASRGLVRTDDQVGAVVRDVISPEAVMDGAEPVRAVDALVVVEQLLLSLPTVELGPISYDVPCGKHDIPNWFDVDF